MNIPLPTGYQRDCRPLGCAGNTGIVILDPLLVALISLAVVAAVALTAGAWHFLFSSSRPTPEPSVAWISDLSPSRYEPMLRLLDESDFRFLSEQPGFTPEMASRLRVQRYRIFRAYLRNLRDDFAGLLAALNFVLANADHDRPELASAMLRAQLAFARRFAVAHIRAFAWRFGIGSVNAVDLLGVFEGIHFELRCLVPQPMAA